MPGIKLVWVCAFALSIGCLETAAPAHSAPLEVNSPSSHSTSTTAKIHAPKNLSVSINGVVVVQRGTATAVSEGVGSIAIARGANSCILRSVRAGVPL
jgi:hypothetical protein